MDDIFPVSEVRSRLPDMIKRVNRGKKHLIITKNGKPEAVMVSPEELETLEIMADPELLRSIRRAQQDITAGKLHSHRDVFKNV